MKKIAHKVINVLVSQWWATVFITVLASFVIILFLGKGQDVWFDEGYSIILAKKPLTELLQLTGVDAHPPLFYVLLKAWGSMFGWSELSLRGMSAVLSAATVGVIAVLLRQLFSTRIALYMLPFIMLAPFWLRYGYEIRMYALAGLIGALGTLLLVAALKNKKEKKWWIFYALSVAAGMYTLYMTAVLWLAHFVWLLIYHRQKFWSQRWVWSYAAAAVLILPYIPTIIFQLTHSALPGVGWTLNLTHMWSVVSIILTYTPEWSVSSWTAAGIMLVALLTLYLIDRARREMSSEGKKSLSLLLCLAIVPISFFIIVSLPMSSPFFVPRYLAHVSLFIYTLIGIAIVLGWTYGYRKVALVLLAVALSLLSWGIYQLSQAGNFNFERMQKPQTLNIRQSIDCSSAVIIADDPYTFINDNYYFEGCNVLFYTKEPLKLQGGYAPLFGSKNEIKSSGELTSNEVVHIYWNYQPKSFNIDSRYQLVSTVTYDKQVADTYQLISE
jgi:uncharacterized membrane protein